MSSEQPGSRSPESSDASDSGGAPENEPRGYEESGEDFARADPDVLLDVPKVHVEELNLEVEELKARVALKTRLSELLEIDVGLDVSLEGVKLETKGVEAEAQLKARLDNVQEMIERTLRSVDDNPELVRDLTNLARGGSSETEEQPALDETDSANGSQEVAGITDAARRKAGELGVDPSSLEGTGSGGRIILRDVQRASRGN